MKNRRYVVASAIAVASFSALFAVLPSHGAGLKVKIVDFRYRPATFQIRAGGAITFENDSNLTHTATCRGCVTDSGDIQPGLIRTVTFTQAGTFQIYCRYHLATNRMAAVITVKT